MKYKNIVFDLDGTLSNSENSILSTLKDTFAEMNAPVPPTETLLKFIGPPLKDSYKKYCGFSETQAEEGLKIYQKHYARKGRDLNELYPEIEELLQTLSARGAKLFVATSKEEEAAKYVLRKLRIAQYFTAVSGANHYNSISTKEEVLLQLIEKEKPEIFENVLVGDTVFDVEGAEKIGMDCIAVSYGFNTAEQLKACGAKAIAATVSELQTILLA